MTRNASTRPPRFGGELGTQLGRKLAGLRRLSRRFPGGGFESGDRGNKEGGDGTGDACDCSPPPAGLGNTLRLTKGPVGDCDNDPLTPDEACVEVSWLPPSGGNVESTQGTDPWGVDRPQPFECPDPTNDLDGDGMGDVCDLG